MFHTGNLPEKKINMFKDRDRGFKLGPIEIGFIAGKPYFNYPTQKIVIEEHAVNKGSVSLPQPGIEEHHVVLEMLDPHRVVLKPCPNPQCTKYFTKERTLVGNAVNLDPVASRHLVHQYN